MEWTRQVLLDAHRRVLSSIHRTPVLTCTGLNQLSGAHLYFKCENFQRTGSFKMRGASHGLACLLEQGPVSGVATHSSGNFAAALACAARSAQLPAVIVMPRNAAAVKKGAVLAYGGRIVECEPTLADREATLERVLEDTGYATLHPYNHPWIIAGQATAALELLEEQPHLDWIVAPVGGGGLLSGTALAARLFGRARVAGAEPAGADDAFRSLKAGHIVPQTNPCTMADGLLTSLGSHTFPLIRDFVDHIERVEEEEIVSALKHLFTRMKIVVEPSSAVALAAVLKSPSVFSGTHTGIILSGGNVDLERLNFNASRS